MTKLFRHTILLLAAVSLVAVSCKDNAIPSDTLGTDGIQQSRVVYDTVYNLRAATGDTIDIETAIQVATELGPGKTSTKDYYIIGAVKGHDTRDKYQFDPQYGNFYVYLGNKIGNRSFYCYRIFGYNGAKFTDLRQMSHGDIVVVCGKIQNYFGSAQLSQGGKLITSDNPLAAGIPAE